MQEPRETPGDGEPAGTVLCIEDDPVSMALAEAVLARYAGLRVLKACNGRDGVRLAQAERPRLVLLDMQLPDISGLDVVRALTDLISQRTLRIVLLTGDAFSIEIAKAMSLGAHDYWRKPLDADRLAETLVRVLGEGADRRRGKRRSVAGGAGFEV